MQSYEILHFLIWSTSGYFLAANSIYLLLLVLSWFDLKTTKGRNRRSNQRVQTEPTLVEFPKVTLLIPAFNEESVIIESLQTQLGVNYQNLEVIVVDDGSTDKTSELVRNEFKMQATDLRRHDNMSKAKVLGIYRSTTDPRLFLVQQENRGKAGALNTALDFASGQYVCTADADTILEPSSVLRIVQAFQDSKREIVAVGGTVRIVNGAEYRDHQVVRGQLPRSHLLNFQIIEYIRAFYCGRSGWQWIQATVLLSGALAAFKTAALREVRGFDESSITEDLEIILRLRWHSISHDKNWGIQLLPDPLCWTQAPSSLSALRRQRIRWQQGLAQTMWKYFSLILNPTYGTAGFFHMPYILVFEWIGPWIELTAYLVGFIGLATGILDPYMVLKFAAIGLAYSVFVSTVSIHFEEYYFARHRNLRSKLKFLSGILLENFGYRQLTWFFRLEAVVRLLVVKPNWGQQTRHSFKDESSRDREAA